MRNFLKTVAVAGVEGGQTTSAEAPSAQAWFEGGERIGYDPRSARHYCERKTRPSGFSCAGRRSCARHLLPAWIP